MPDLNPRREPRYARPRPLAQPGPEHFASRRMLARVELVQDTLALRNVWSLPSGRAGQHLQVIEYSTGELEAQLVQGELGERCPACGQTVHPDATHVIDPGLPTERWTCRQIDPPPLEPEHD